MRFLQDIPIARKLTWIIMTTSVVALMLASSGFVAYELLTARGTARNQLEVLANVIGANSTAALVFGDSTAAAEALSALGTESDVLSAYLYDRQDAVLATYTAAPSKPDFKPPPPRQEMTYHSFNRGGLTVSRKIFLDGEPVGTIAIESELKDFYHRLKRYALIVAGVIFASGLGALLISWKLQRLISGPIMSLAQTAGQVSAKRDYGVRAKHQTNDELGALTNRFNEMLVQIQARDVSLQMARDSLEERVRERTKELEREVVIRERAQRDLAKARDEAVEASRLKSEFLANMSHEIRTPMNGIMGMTELALDTELTPEQRECLSVVSKSADSLLTIINDILDFSKIEAGKLELSPDHFRLSDCVGDTLRTMAVKAHQKGLELAFRIMPGIPEDLIGDGDRLRQIIMNLVGNAIKFTERGEVEIRVWPESVTDDSARLHFMVRDTGVGIPPERQRVIFEAFRQADGSTTRRYGGTGLGLTISRQLIGLMGGRMWVESEEGEGSTFHFTANFGVHETEGNPEQVHMSSSLQNRRVLIVDDNATNRRILEEITLGWGMLPTLADTGDNAVAEIEMSLLSRRSYDLILMDMMIPGKDGMQTTEEIRRIPGAEHIPIVLLSSADRVESSDRLARLGIRAYATKPVKQSILLRATLSALESNHKEVTSVAYSDHGRTTQDAIPGDRSLSILLAEDNLVNQKLALRMLEKAEHDVTVANNGEEAVSAWEVGDFDLILMDVQMPVMSGIRATEAIRAREIETGGHIPIVAMTAHAMKGDRERFLDAGMDGYVSKPVRKRLLYSAIETAMTKSEQEEVISRLVKDEAMA